MLSVATAGHECHRDYVRTVIGLRMSTGRGAVTVVTARSDVNIACMIDTLAHIIFRNQHD